MRTEDKPWCSDRESRDRSLWERGPVKKKPQKAQIKVLEWKNIISEVKILLGSLGNFPDLHNY